MVARLTRILDAFDAPQTVLSLDDLTSHTGLPSSTTHRIVVQLTRSAWLQRLSDGGYRLGARAFRFRGSHSSSHEELRKIAVEAVRALSLGSGLVAHLAVLDGPDVLVLDKIGGPAAALVPSRVGGRHAPHISTCGRAMLAMLPPETVDDMTEGRAFGRGSVWTPGTFYQELDRVRRRRGIAIDETGENTRGIASVAGSFGIPGLPRASISVCLGRPTDALRVVPQLSAAIRAIERAAEAHSVPR
ncbi:IclR family transcriptional regulator [Prescottella sp. R16]|uniref:IclR family transcriptional regulator n=1 Tax=Prescottella sp. R16 TaxID=3064529 RepID=UPI00272EE095|nr:helix-turn-helix domain-containing protein [Prescottella sp. R16]